MRELGKFQARRKNTETAGLSSDKINIRIFINGRTRPSGCCHVAKTAWRGPRETSVFFVVDSVDTEYPGGHLRYFLMPPQELKVSCNAELTEELSAVVGSENFRFHADNKTKSGASAGSTGR